MHFSHILSEFSNFGNKPKIKKIPSPIYYLLIGGGIKICFPQLCTIYCLSVYVSSTFFALSVISL